MLKNHSNHDGKDCGKDRYDASDGGLVEYPNANQSDEWRSDAVDTQQICPICNIQNNQWAHWDISPEQIVDTILEVRQQDFQSNEEFLRDLRNHLPFDVNVKIKTNYPNIYIKWRYKKAKGEVTFGHDGGSTVQILDYCRGCGEERK